MPRIFILMIILLCFSRAFSQCPASAVIWATFDSIASNATLTVNAKRDKALASVKQFELCHSLQDSNYLKLLSRLASLHYFSEHNSIESIRTLKKALPVCRGIIDRNTATIVKKLYSDYVFYLIDVSQYSTALAYNDTLLNLYDRYSGSPSELSKLHMRNYRVYYFTGDFQKAIDESIIGINIARRSDAASDLTIFYNLLAQALYFNNKFKEAQKAADSAYQLAIVNENHYEIATSLKTKALIKANAEKDLTAAGILFQQAITERKITNSAAQLANDYNDFGTIYLKANSESAKTSRLYSEAYRYAVQSQNDELKVKALVNLSQSSWRAKNYDQAWKYFQSASAVLGLDSTDKLHAIKVDEWLTINNTDLVTVMMNNRLELLLTNYRITGDKQYLNAGLKLAVVADSVITYLRHQQAAEQSKLLWRSRTRELYQYALEASFLSSNHSLAFFFMEKSRAVLLGDKLSELNALRLLPSHIVQKEQELSLAVIQQQLQLSPGSSPFSNQHLSLIKARDDLATFIKSLEKNYPGYYRVKYANDVPSLQQLQSYLLQHQQTFVHYFMADTVAYVMTIQANDAVIKKISQPKYNRSDIVDFLRLCSQPALLNANYNTYQELSAKLYDTYLQPFGIKKGRVIICPDNYFIPFEAIVTGEKPNHFLLNDYAFSYVYAARNLLMNFPLKASSGNFLGIAPVAFASHLKVPSLRASGKAITTTADFYQNSKLIIGEKATKHSFLNNIGNYEVVNVYSHALSDSSMEEPAIYMSDSIIYLSELQLIKDISAQLVLLSACQTSVGKQATGEGIYSLARGLAAVGIPAVAATLWEADEASIYLITHKFNEGISKGLPKDIALQEAKIWYISHANAEKKLAPYWSNMIIIGDVSPVVFSNHFNMYRWILLPVLVLLLLTVIFNLVKRNNSKKRQLSKPS